MDLNGVLRMVFAWVAYGAILWWIGRAKQIRRLRDLPAPARRSATLLLRLCGVHGRVRALYPPFTVIQITGIAIAVAVPLLIVSVGPDNAILGQITDAVLIFSLFPSAIAMLVMWLGAASRDIGSRR